MTRLEDVVFRGKVDGKDSYSDLTNATFEQVDFKYVDFEGCALKNTEFRECGFEGSDDKRRLYRPVFGNCDLDSAHFYGCTLPSKEAFQGTVFDSTEKNRGGESNYDFLTMMNQETTPAGQVRALLQDYVNYGKSSNQSRMGVFSSSVKKILRSRHHTVSIRGVIQANDTQNSPTQIIQACIQTLKDYKGKIDRKSGLASRFDLLIKQHGGDGTRELQRSLYTACSGRSAEAHTPPAGPQGG